ncbi:hypothetical protein Q8A73_003268 [Channa argus]|nr:hypothetical protein Q8A73_003268 [Channa argus]
MSGLNTLRSYSAPSRQAGRQFACAHQSQRLSYSLLLSAAERGFVTSVRAGAVPWLERKKMGRRLRGPQTGEPRKMK